MVTVTNHDFEKAQGQFQEFLVKNGYPAKLIWISARDVLLTGRKMFYVKVPVSERNQLRARDHFQIGVTRQLGVSMRAVAEVDGVACCYVWVPADEAESREALMTRDVKMSVNIGESKIAAKSVRSDMRWRCLKVLHRKNQARKAELFWG